ncbi:type VII secretion integral membrane protein EccD [Nocardia sp. NPDC057668]|uniref:type VII secretion integral membrane protein EccD n=1 Tax=Nocardia sp. NPDC057668 TaxID=3346202 RepID=UPI00366B39AD
MRVAVLVARYQVDVVLPTAFTIETFIDDLLAVLRGAINDDTVEFAAAQGHWTLARPGDHPMPRWRCLADHDIADGAVLLLASVESAEVFTPVVEDITDALAVINDREFAEFDPPTAAIVGLIALSVGALTVAALLTWSWTLSGSILTCAVPALLLGSTSWVAAITARRRFGSVPTCVGLLIPAVSLLFVGAAMLVPNPYNQPGPFNAANVAAGSIIAVLAATAASRLTAVATSFLTAVVTVTGCGTVVCFLLAMTAIPLPRVLGGVVLAGLILLTIAPRLAMILARIRPPDLPDPGSEISPATLEDLFDAETTRRDVSDEDYVDPGERDPDDAATDFESRARVAVTSLRGLIAAITTILVGGALGPALLSPTGNREIVLAVAIAGVLAMRSRWYPDRIQAIALLSGATAIAVGLAAILVSSYPSPVARAVVLVVLTGTAVGATLATFRLPGRRLSPVTRRIIDLIEYALIVLVPVLACWIMGVYTAMRSL